MQHHFDTYVVSICMVTGCFNDLAIVCVSEAVGHYIFWKMFYEND